MEGRYNIKAGDTITSLEGNVQKLDESMLMKSGLTGEEARQAADRKMFIEAKRLAKQGQQQPSM